jgi:DNA gyrase inhibitor GyrI
MSNSSKRWLWVGGAALAGAALTRWQLARLFTEEPRYQLERQIGPLEIRRYPSHWVAETRVGGVGWEAALNEGFRRLARYVFGANHRPLVLPPSGSDADVGVGSETPDLSLTVQGRLQAEKLAMTAPVNASDNGDRTYTIAFNMPRGRTGASLPVPDDERVMLTSKPPRRVAVLRYRGRYTADKVASKFAELMARLREAGLTHRGDPEFAGYDPPTTLPLLRRNEVWVDLAPA